MGEAVRIKELAVAEQALNSAASPSADKQDLLEMSDRLSLEPLEISSVKKLLRRVEGPNLRLEDLWRLMDEVWNEMGLDNTRPDWVRIGEYYNHPIWSLSGLFVETDPVSQCHRQAWCQWMRDNIPHHRENLTVADYGGGFGSLAALLAEDPTVRIDIVEPHSSPAAHRRFRGRDNVEFVPDLRGKYDFVFCSDVLEHLFDPVGVLADLVQATKFEGKLLIANNFYPVIQCHLPTTYHLRYSFTLIARISGLRNIGRPPCNHGQGFQRMSRRAAPMMPMRLAEFLSKKYFAGRQHLSRLRHHSQRTASATK
jgi:SAM-dependent methyltransferase